MHKQFKDLFFNEWKQAIKQCLTKLEIHYNKEAEIAYAAIHNFWLIEKEYARHAIMDSGLDLLNPNIKQHLEAFLQPLEPLEDYLERIKDAGAKENK